MVRATRLAPSSATPRKPCRLAHATIRRDDDNDQWECETDEGWRISDDLAGPTIPGDRPHYWFEDTKRQLLAAVRGNIVPDDAGGETE